MLTAENKPGVFTATACYWLQRCCRKCQYPTPPNKTARKATLLVFSVSTEELKRYVLLSTVRNAAWMTPGTRSEDRAKQ